MSAATIPTKRAAMPSIVAMMRSIVRRIVRPCFSPPPRTSHPRVVAVDVGPGLLPQRGRIASRLGHGAGPGILQGRGRGLPFREVTQGDLVDLVAGDGPHLVAPGRLEGGPG